MMQRSGRNFFFQVKRLQEGGKKIEILSTNGGAGLDRQKLLSIVKGRRQRVI